MKLSVVTNVTLALLFTSWLTPASAQSSRAPTLLAELRHSASGESRLSEGLAHILYFSPPLITEVGEPLSAVSAGALIGNVDVGGQDFAHFDASNTPDFDLFATLLTDGVNDTIWTSEVPYDASGNVTGRRTQNGGPELDRLDADLEGDSVSFIRLITGTGRGLVWQFWSGDPVALGGGQQADVDGFLSYLNPLDKTTSWGSKTFIDVIVIYGPTIDPLSFEATLDGESVLGFFTPVPNTIETVTIPLLNGRNTLLLSVEGTKPSGQTAKDRDRMTFVTR